MLVPFFLGQSKSRIFPTKKKNRSHDLTSFTAFFGLSRHPLVVIFFHMIFHEKFKRLEYSIIERIKLRYIKPHNLNTMIKSMIYRALTFSKLLQIHYRSIFSSFMPFNKRLNHLQKTVNAVCVGDNVFGFRKCSRPRIRDFMIRHQHLNSHQIIAVFERY